MSLLFSSPLLYLLFSSPLLYLLFSSPCSSLSISSSSLLSPPFFPFASWLLSSLSGKYVFPLPTSTLFNPICPMSVIGKYFLSRNLCIVFSISKSSFQTFGYFFIICLIRIIIMPSMFKSLHVMMWCIQICGIDSLQTFRKINSIGYYSTLK